MTVRLIEGDCRQALLELPEASVHCVVTSPPYFGLRDYDHPDQIGLERSVDEYVGQLVEVFRLVRRVLRSDGSVWLNLGDSYATDGGAGTQGRYGQRVGRRHVASIAAAKGVGGPVKPKDLIGVPWRVALALQADGWWLREDIVWNKPNPMPESVRDRCTRSHEFIFHLAKAEAYYHDPVAVEEPAQSDKGNARTFRGGGAYTDGHSFRNQEPKERSSSGNAANPTATRNRRSVWTIATRPFAEAHFATYPVDLPDLCIRAGTSEGGVCAGCGAPWVRVVERETSFQGNSALAGRTPEEIAAAGKWSSKDRGKRAVMSGPVIRTKTKGWEPSCDCPQGGVAPAVVLDPFGGAGTTGLAADRLGRDALLIEINPQNIAMAERRLRRDAPLFQPVETA